MNVREMEFPAEVEFPRAPAEGRTPHQIRGAVWSKVKGLLRAIQDMPEDERGKLQDIYDVLEKYTR